MTINGNIDGSNVRTTFKTGFKLYTTFGRMRRFPPPSYSAAIVIVSSPFRHHPTLAFGPCVSTPLLVFATIMIRDKDRQPDEMTERRKEEEKRRGRKEKWRKEEGHFSLNMRPYHEADKAARLRRMFSELVDSEF